MAKKSTSGAAAPSEAEGSPGQATPLPAIDLGASYRIVLTGAVELRPGLWARPGDDVVLSGAKLALLGDKVARYEPA